MKQFIFNILKKSNPPLYLKVEIQTSPKSSSPLRPLRNAARMQQTTSGTDTFLSSHPFFPF